MGYGHVFLTVFLFSGFPLISLIWYGLARWTTNVNDTFIGPYFAFYLIDAIPLVIWYDEMIHAMIFDDFQGIIAQHFGNIAIDEEDEKNYEEFL